MSIRRRRIISLRSPQDIQESPTEPPIVRFLMGFYLASSCVLRQQSTAGVCFLGAPNAIWLLWVTMPVYPQSMALSARVAR